MNRLQEGNAMKYYEDSKLNQSGMFCSRDYLKWLLEMNEEKVAQDREFSGVVGDFSNSGFKKFYEEQERMMNEFSYRITDEGDGIRLERSYDVMFVPYLQTCNESCLILEKEQPVKDFMFGYNIISVDKSLPKSYERSYRFLLRHRPGIMGIIVTMMREKRHRLHGFHKTMDDYEIIWCRTDYEDAEAGNERARAMADPYQDLNVWGNRIMEYNVVCSLRDEVERLGIVRKSSEHYEIRLMACVASIIELSMQRYRVGEKIPKIELLKYTNKRFNQYCEFWEEDELYEVSNDLVDVRKINVKFIADWNKVVDPEDVEDDEYYEWDYYEE